MRGEKAGVQQKVREHFKNAHYVHCYAHQLNLIMQQATSRIKKVNIFFSDLSGIATFFSRSPKRTSILDQTVARRLPRASSTRWNFNSRVVNTVYENRDDLIQCFEAIRTGSLGSFDQPFFTKSCPTSTFCTRSSRRRTSMLSSSNVPSTASQAVCRP